MLRTYEGLNQKSFGVKPHRLDPSLTTVYDTVPPVSHHWSCQSGESNLRAWISGDVQVWIRLRRFNSMHLARKKGSPRCAMKLSFREFINKKILPRKLSPLKNNNFAKLFGLFGCS